MLNFPNLNREFLNKRHRLSHSQIDQLLNEKYSKKYLDEKYLQLFQLSEFMKLSDKFQESNIPFIPLKGPMLSYRLHKDPSYRYSWDLDFLIPINLIPKTIQVLKDSGYIPYYFNCPENSNLQHKLIKWHHHLSFVHPERNTYIEIHWKLFTNNLTNSKIITDVIKSNRNQLQFNNHIFEVFNNEFELVYLIIHGGLHAWRRLKWLVDIKDFIENIPIDPKKFKLLVKQFNAGRMVSLCNATLTHYFPTCALLPSESVAIPKKLLNYTISEIENEKDTSNSLLEKITYSWFRMQCFPGFRFKYSVTSEIFITHYLKSIEYQETS